MNEKDWEWNDSESERPIYNKSNTATIDNSELEEWGDEQFARLVEFDDSLDSPLETFSNDTLPEEFTQSNDSNAVSIAELFDDPIEGRTSPRFSSRPFPKAAAVGLALLVVFGGGGLFLQGVMSGAKRKAPMIASSPSPESTPSASPSPETEVGNLKTQLALGNQENQIKDLESSKSPKTPNTTLTKTEPTKTPNSTPSRTVASPTQPTPPTYPARPVQERYTPPLPRSVESTRPVQERYTPPLSRSVKLARPTTPTSQPTSTSAPTPPSKQQTLDPMQQWMALSQLGSFGTNSVGGEEDTGTRRRGDAENFSTESPRVIEAASTNLPQPLNAPIRIGEPTSEIPTEQVPPVVAQINPVEEASILSGVPVRFLQVGTQARAQLVTPLVWAKSDSASGEKFVVQLSEPMANLPQGTTIVFQVVAVSESGLVQLNATSLVVDGQEYVLPPGAISVRGQDGQPLIADKWGDKGQAIASGDVTAFLFGSLSKVGEVLNQPDVQQSINSSSGGFSSSTTTSNRRPNLLGAILEGGFDPLTDQILQRNDQVIQEIMSRPNVWYIRAGENVQVFVNQSFEL